MKTTKLLTAIAAIVIAVLLNSCTKGDMGPAGPAGTSGVAGATGPTGANGTNGNSNVTVTTYTITPGSWLSIAGKYGVNLAAPALTNIDSDAVNVSVSQTAGLDLALPSSGVLVSGDYMSFGYKTGNVAIEYTYSSAPTVNLVFTVAVTK